LLGMTIVRGFPSARLKPRPFKNPDPSLRSG
jgi:hypothetical protein